MVSDRELTNQLSESGTRLGADPQRFSREWPCARLNFADEKKRDCHSVELRALCNEVPRTPPGPEGSNGTG